MDRKTYDAAFKILLALEECVDKAILQLEELEAGEENILKVGDLVQLKSGSDLLTVDEVRQNELIVVYFHEFKKQFEQFKLSKESIVKVEAIKGDKE